MKAVDVGKFDECFTHIAEDGTQTTWASTALYNFCVQQPTPAGVALGLVPVEETHAQFCLDQRGVEEDRLKVLLENPEYLKKPILFVHTPDDTHLLVDGTHRYVCYYGLELSKIPAYMVEWDVARTFIIEDLPDGREEDIMGPSHITVLRRLGLVK